MGIRRACRDNDALFLRRRGEGFLPLRQWRRSDREKQSQRGWIIVPCSDGHAYTAPVGSFRRTLSGCTTCTGTRGNGWRIAGTTITGELHRTARPGYLETVVAGWSAAVPGAIFEEPSLRQPPLGTSRSAGAASTASGWGGRLAHDPALWSSRAKSVSNRDAIFAGLCHLGQHVARDHLDKGGTCELTPRRLRRAPPGCRSSWTSSL